MSSFSNPIDFFSILNARGTDYLVLRNYENLTETDSFFLDGHPDIDILCRDSMEIVNSINAQTTRKDIPPFKGDGTHYYIFIEGKKVSLDLRFPGDGYYCQTWEEDMLQRKRMVDGFYVMAPEDYFFSLIYHAVVQKRVFTEEYRIRLIEMAADLGLFPDSLNENGFLSLLQDYMRKHGYVFEYTKDCTVPCRFHLVDKKLIRNDWSRRFIHWRFDTKVSLIEMLVHVKHVLFR